MRILIRALVVLTADLGLPANPSKSKSNHTVEIIGAVAIGLLALMVLGRCTAMPRLRERADSLFYL